MLKINVNKTTDAYNFTFKQQTTAAYQFDSIIIELSVPALIALL